MAIPVYCWDETWLHALLSSSIRYFIVLHETGLVNSWGHLSGSRPYDKGIEAREMFYLNIGEAYHNYHHAFPSDYSASELGAWGCFNPPTAIINFFNLIGWATDLKRANPQMVEARCQMKGDHSNRYDRWYGIKNQILGFCCSIFVFPFLPMLLFYLIFQ